MEKIFQTRATDSQNPMHFTLDKTVLDNSRASFLINRMLVSDKPAMKTQKTAPGMYARLQSIYPSTYLSTYLPPSIHIMWIDLCVAPSIYRSI